MYVPFSKTEADADLDVSSGSSIMIAREVDRRVSCRVEGGVTFDAVGARIYSGSQMRAKYQ
jgi:hypothetical protein